MAYTQADLDAVKTARVDLAKGNRVVTVVINGRTTQYAATDDLALARLELSIQQELDAAATPAKQRHFVVTSRKGLA